MHDRAELGDISCLAKLGELSAHKPPTHGQRIFSPGKVAVRNRKEIFQNAVEKLQALSWLSGSWWRTGTAAIDQKRPLHTVDICTHQIVEPQNSILKFSETRLLPVEPPGEKLHSSAPSRLVRQPETSVLSQKYISGPEQFPDCSLDASLLLGALRPELRTR